MSNYVIKIINCTCIEEAEVEIRKNTLNIKYGPNGLGKSSIAKAIVAAVAGGAALQALKPFKYRSSPDPQEPSVTGVENVKSVLVFDDSYVSQVTFQRDEVLRNSFEIFIKSDDYIKSEREIEELLAGIKSSFGSNLDLVKAIADLKDLGSAFEFTKTGALSKSSKGYKALGSGNRIENIPGGLENFKNFIQSEQAVAWISWQAKGNGFVPLSDRCPYCSSELTLRERELACSVSDRYDSKAVEHLGALQEVICRLGEYFTPDCRAALERIVKSEIGLSAEAENFLSNLRGDIDTLIAKLEVLSCISFYSFSRVDSIGEEELSRLKIELDLIGTLDSEKTRATVRPINEELEELAKKVGPLRGKINIHKDRIRKSVESNESSINKFLRLAGYKYKVAVRPEASSYKMKLIHQDHGEHIEAASQHLSYGEKNAFALVLFMHQVLSEKPDLAILDDPVSSFDKAKKFAILSELFRGGASLRDMTVLMLTHDIEPAIDTICCAKQQFQNPKPVAYFLASRAGRVSELEFKDEDIQTFAQICTENIRGSVDEVIKCIYLRRHFEIIDNLGVEYNYLSNLLHARDVPVFKTNSGSVKMSDGDIASAVEAIREFIPDFDYCRVLGEIKNRSEMERRFVEARAGYDKIQLFRIFWEVHSTAKDPNNSILQKFVNESFHIENEYVMQLNPRKFDNVPEYIVEECRRLIEGKDP